MPPSEDGLARFRREAKAMAMLSHRAIARAFDLVELDPGRGSLVLIMELLRGHTLACQLEHMGPLDVQATLEIILPSSRRCRARGLGMVHRDIKPENVFLAMEPDGQQMPKPALCFNEYVLLSTGELRTVRRAPG